MRPVLSRSIACRTGSQLAVGLLRCNDKAGQILVTRHALLAGCAVTAAAPIDVVFVPVRDLQVQPGYDVRAADSGAGCRAAHPMTIIAGIIAGSLGGSLAGPGLQRALRMAGTPRQSPG